MLSTSPPPPAAQHDHALHLDEDDRQSGSGRSARFRIGPPIEPFHGAGRWPPRPTIPFVGAVSGSVPQTNGSGREIERRRGPRSGFPAGLVDARLASSQSSSTTSVPSKIRADPPGRHTGAASSPPRPPVELEQLFPVRRAGRPGELSTGRSQPSLREDPSQFHVRVCRHVASVRMTLERDPAPTQFVAVLA